MQVVKSKVGPVNESPPKGKKMGDVVADAGAGPYTAGSSSVTASFVGACPRNNLRLQGTFLEVQQSQANGTWATYATDGDVETRLRFEKKDSGPSAALVFHCGWLLRWLRMWDVLASNIAFVCVRLLLAAYELALVWL